MHARERPGKNQPETFFSISFSTLAMIASITSTGVTVTVANANANAGRVSRKLDQSRNFRSNRVVAANASTKSGASASGYAVAGLRPTSPKAWGMIAEDLKKNGLRFAKASEATKRGVLVIDIRPVQDYGGYRTRPTCARWSRSHAQTQFSLALRALLVRQTRAIFPAR